MDDLISAEEFETVFAKLYQVARRVPFDIKTTEAQHYRRYVLQMRAAARKNRESSNSSTASHTLEMPNGMATEKDADGIGRAPRGLNDGKGFIFISHLGEVFPSGFLPMSAGNVRRQTLAEIYRHSPLFVSLRDTSRLQGKCGVCEFRNVCGGSRARAFALTGNPFAEEPCCVYEPKTSAVYSVQADSETRA